MPMQQKIINGEDLFTEMPNPGSVWDAEPGFEHYWQWPKDIGSGFLYIIKLRPGLMIGMGNFQLQNGLSINFKVKRMPFIILSYIISASSRMVSNWPQGNAKNVILYTPGQSRISFQPSFQGSLEYPPGHLIRNLGIYIDPALLNAFINDQRGMTPLGINNILDWNDENFCCIFPQILAANRIFNQILNYPYQGQFKRLYFESKTLELLTHTLEQIIALPNDSLFTESTALDNAPIHQARDILIHNLEKPPSLIDLAKKTGINKNKLNNGFRQVFGTSVFEYLRIYRLERAKLLLETQKRNVTEVALEVGYAQQGSFTRAFKNHFGTNPSDHR